jgi:glycosyltransferase involved in cell wall biosynthesis
MTLPVAIVTSWFGRELKGGAEQLAWQVATRLAARGHRVEVLTTCCRSFLDDWSVNHLPPGEEEEEGVVIRRFPVQRRLDSEFAAANNFVLSIPRENLLPGVNPFTCGTGDIFIHENIKSPALLKYLRRNREKYHAFIFLPYLYGPILNGLPLVAERAWLQPCLHDEAYAYLPRVEELFRMARGILYNSDGEARLARTLYGPGIADKETVVGVGVETTGPGEDIPAQVGPLEMDKDRFVLCLGRRDVHKNTLFLTKAFAAFKRTHPSSSLKLALAGPGEENYNDPTRGIVDLGLVSEEEKEALLTHCLALFHPSENESYSRVIMEAWFHERPVAAHRNCLATSIAVDKAGGGWLAGDEAEWRDLFAGIEKLSGQELRSLGKQGKKYARQYAVWDRVIDRYEEVLGLNGREEEHRISLETGLSAVHQLLPGFAFGDAISNQAMLIRDYLRSRGLKSTIFTEQIDPSMTNEAELFKDGRAVGAGDGLLYHHSIGSGLMPFLEGFSGPRCLIYHNITPPDLVRKHNPGLAAQLQQGLDELPVLSRIFSVAAGVSRFNAQELEEHGFSGPEIMPICVDPAKWNIPAAAPVMYELQDGRTNILFVGRVIDNKCQHDLIRAFAHLRRFDPSARLLLVGGYDEREPYYQTLVRLIEERDLRGDVFFAGKVDDSYLHAYYRTADLYFSMSEHEGFGVPFIEAMWFDVPVLAYRSSAVPETLGQGGVLFTEKDDLEQVAALAHVLISNQDVRGRVLAAQQERRQDFLPDRVLPVLDRLIKKMEFAC